MSTATPGGDVLGPVPQAPEAPHPQFPSVRVGSSGKVLKFRPRLGRSPSAPRVGRNGIAPRSAVGQAREHAKQPAQIIHIHQTLPAQPSAASAPTPAPAPAPAAKPKSAAQTARDALGQVMGKHIAGRMQGVPAEGHRLMQSHARAHGRTFVDEYHKAGMDRARDLVKQAQQGAPGYKPPAAKPPVPAGPLQAQTPIATGPATPTPPAGGGNIAGIAQDLKSRQKLSPTDAPAATAPDELPAGHHLPKDVLDAMQHEVDHPANEASPEARARVQAVNAALKKGKLGIKPQQPLQGYSPPEEPKAGES